MAADDVTKGEHVDGEEEGSKHGALRHALVEWDWGGAGASDGNKLFFCWREMSGTRREQHR